MDNFISKTQMQTILDNRPKGLSMDDVINTYRQNGYKVEGIDPTPEPTLTQKLAQTGKETLGNVGDTMNRVATVQTSVPSGVLQTAGNVAEGALKATGNVITSTPVVKDVVGAIAKPISEGVKATQDWLANNPTFQKVVSSDVADKIALVLDSHPDIARNAEAINNIANAVLLAKGGVQTAGKIVDTAKATGQKFISSVDEVKNLVPKNLSQKAVDLVSADPEAKVATILKESTPEDVTKFVSMAEKASQDPRVATPFEVTGENLGKSAKIIKDKAKAIAEQKKAIIQQEQIGGKQFIEPIDQAVAKFEKLATKYPEAQQFVDALKGKVTKLQADTAIDDLQDILYTSSKKMTIPTGSRLAQQAKAIVGELNGKLKASLPPEYTTLNDQYSKIVQNLGLINSSLGEVVGGVPTRGASLIKQFFSPSGTKAKELFKFVKDETGIDLAKEATLSKFAMELFDDPRARSLLQGVGDIPTTLTGVVTKVAEKLGGDKLRESMRASTIRKARKISETK